MKTSILAIGAALALASPAFAQSSAQPSSGSMGGSAAMQTQNGQSQAATQNGMTATGMTANATSPATPAQNANMSPGAFVNHAAMYDEWEMQSAKLAMKHAKGQNVQDYAKNLYQDAGQARKVLVQTAGNLQGVTVVKGTKLDDQHQKMLKTLKQAEGSKFDAKFIQMQIQAQKNELAALKAYAQSGDNEHLQTFASNEIPAVQKDLQKAQSLQTNSMGSNG